MLKRVLFTLGVLAVYRLGTYIPLPGVDGATLQEILAQQRGGVIDIFDLFTGGGLSRMSIFALGVLPYISAVIILQLMQVVSPQLEQLKKGGEAGRTKLNQYTRYGTVFLAAFQAYGLVIGLEGMHAATGSVVANPGMVFQASVVVTLTAGSTLLMWLCEQITQRGVGNGIALIIFAGIIAILPSALADILERGWMGALSTIVIVGFVLLSVVAITTIVFFERAQRRIVVQYPKRQVGSRTVGGESSHMPLKLNTSGVIPPIFASLLLLPFATINFGGDQGPEWLDTVNTLLGRGQPLFLINYASLIVFFAFFYSSIVFNPEETADNLRKFDGFIPGIRPGKHTADYLARVMNRLTAVGALYLSVVCVVPEWVISRFALPFHFSGVSLLILVLVILDTMGRIHASPGPPSDSPPNGYLSDMGARMRKSA